MGLLFIEIEELPELLKMQHSIPGSISVHNLREMLLLQDFYHEIGKNEIFLHSLS